MYGKAHHRWNAANDLAVGDRVNRLGLVVRRELRRRCDAIQRKSLELDDKDGKQG